MKVILTEREFCRLGLQLVGFDSKKQNRVCSDTNLERFRSFYGSNPIVVAQIWEDLQNSTFDSARFEPTCKTDASHFLMFFHFVKAYPTEPLLAGMFGVCEKTARKWIWRFAEKVQALKRDKIVWPDTWVAGNHHLTDDVFLLSVDGIHCRINEPKHPTLSKNPLFYSHKFHQAGVGYEVAMSLFRNQIVWMNGPFPSGRPDVQIFREGGLKEKIPPGKRIIADNGYRGEKTLVSTPNSHEPKMLRKFKGRARSRQETINSRIKNYKILDIRFRHGVDMHRTAFEAVCVICQYQLELGSPLFDL